MNDNENTYCHGIINCKYYHDECTFMYMGSGDPDDMLCRVQAMADYRAFCAWREQREKGEEK